MHLARRRHLLALTLAAVVASGCTTFEPVPKDYTGPTAVSRDSGDAESATKARLFAVVQIEGHHVPNAFSASVNASHGRGAMLTTVHPERRIKAAPTRLLLRASQATGAPIQAMAAQIAGAFFSGEGTVEFTPQPGGAYVVKGTLGRPQSSVWIADAATGQRVSAIVDR